MDDIKIQTSDEKPPKPKTMKGGKNKDGGTLVLWQEGQSGNPSGRPKGARGLKNVMREMLDAPWDIDVNGEKVRVTVRQALVITKINLALASANEGIQLMAIKQIEDQIDGKPIPYMETPDGEQVEAAVFYFPNQHNRKIPK